MLGSNVLVATDGSERADDSIRKGHERAQRDGGRLTVLCVVTNLLRQSPLFPQENQDDAARVLLAEKNAAEAVRERVVTVTGRDPLDFSVVVDNGTPDGAIVHAAASMKATLLVVGADTSALAHIEKRVLHYAHTSVLVVRPRRGSLRYLVATDFSEGATHAIRAIAPEAKARGARVTLVHAVDVFPSHMFGWGAPFGVTWVVPPRELVADVRAAAETALDDVLQEYGLEGDSLVVEGDASGAIVEAARDVDAELVVVAARGRTTLSQWLLGSVAERVAAEAPCSVLAVRRP